MVSISHRAIFIGLLWIVLVISITLCNKEQDSSLRNRYIIQFKHDTSFLTRSQHWSMLRAHHGSEFKIKSNFGFQWFSGYTAEIPSPIIVEYIRRLPFVESVEPDSLIYTFVTASSSISFTKSISLTKSFTKSISLTKSTSLSKSISYSRTPSRSFTSSRSFSSSISLSSSTTLSPSISSSRSLSQSSSRSYSASTSRSPSSSSLPPSPSPASATTTCTSQSIPDGAWGLARIAVRPHLTDASTYTYPSLSSPSPVNVYIIDSGIYSAHPDFNGRAQSGTNFVANESNSDLNGHGTHVAGIIGGVIYGVSKSVQLIPVKVLGATGYGTTSDLIKGINWIAQQQSMQGGSGPRCVVNMSLGLRGVVSSIIDASNALSDAGCVVVVAAGNGIGGGEDACSYSPAAASKVVAVGAIDRQDSVAWFSNYGACVGVSAPGVGVQSDWKDGGVYMLDGTSQATPYAAGVVANYLSANPSVSVDQAKNWLYSTATTGMLASNYYNTLDRIVYQPCP